MTTTTIRRVAGTDEAMNTPHLPAFDPAAQACDADPLHSYTESVFGEVTCAHCYGHGGYITCAGVWGPCTSCRGAETHVGHRADWTRAAWARLKRRAP